jgi:hypothetical protein
MVDRPSVENPLDVPKVEAAILQDALPLRLVPFKHEVM